MESTFSNSISIETKIMRTHGALLKERLDGMKDTMEASPLPLCSMVA
jgi:hypothetical protein